MGLSLALPSATVDARARPLAHRAGMDQASLLAADVARLDRAQGDDRQTLQVQEAGRLAFSRVYAGQRRRRA